MASLVAAMLQSRHEKIWSVPGFATRDYCCLLSTEQRQSNWLADPKFWAFQDFPDLGGINLYGWISIVSLVYLLPFAIVIEGPTWQSAWTTAVANVGKEKLLW
jgi:hypothetical protein